MLHKWRMGQRNLDLRVVREVRRAVAYSAASRLSTTETGALSQCFDAVGFRHLQSNKILAIDYDDEEEPRKGSGAFGDEDED